METELIISGAGAAGLTLAVDLAACVVDTDAIESVEDYLDTVGVRRPR